MMINVQIGTDGVPSERKVTLGNKYENNDESIHFDLPQEFDSYYKYVIGVISVNGENHTVVLPVNENIMVVSSALTYYAGNWSLYLMCRQNTIDLDVEQIDITAKPNEHVFISDGFIGVVNKSSIEADIVNNLPLDTNLKPIYDDLIKLKEQLEEIVFDGITWDEVTQKPTEFPPTVHSHDDLYYTKTEVDEKLPAVVEETVIPKIKEEVIPEVVPEIVDAKINGEDLLKISITATSENVDSENGGTTNISTTYVDWNTLMGDGTAPENVNFSIDYDGIVYTFKGQRSMFVDNTLAAYVSNRNISYVETESSREFFDARMYIYVGLKPDNSCSVQITENEVTMSRATIQYAGVVKPVRYKDENDTMSVAVEFTTGALYVPYTDPNETQVDSLTTTDKTLSGAINELKSTAGTLEQNTALEDTDITNMLEEVFG